MKMLFGRLLKICSYDLDSIQQYYIPSERMNPVVFWMNRKIQLVQDKYPNKELKEKFIESFVHNLSKSLFI